MANKILINFFIINQNKPIKAYFFKKYANIRTDHTCKSVHKDERICQGS